ncbi:hypothetical protein GCM10009416_36360 [Craurococcus roseus]|uniref:DUF2283 domain-containing protein n=1 Tax=Craurococcus roseus TaxID=77585 RepID=A0ABN1FP11_9PROT
MRSTYNRSNFNLRWSYDEEADRTVVTFGDPLGPTRPELEIELTGVRDLSLSDTIV